MGKKSRGRKRPERTIKPIAEGTPLPERYKSYSFDGQDLGHGISEVSVEVSVGGVVGAQKAHRNDFQSPALDGLAKARVLHGPESLGEDERRTIANRRKDAGVFLLNLYHQTGQESKSTALYDKVSGQMLSGEVRRQSDFELDAEVEYHRLMKLIRPYDTVISNVVIHNQRPDYVVRNGSRVLCNWTVALQRGLDLLADELFGSPIRRRRPNR